LQLITKLVKIPFLSELFGDGARSLSPDNISQMGDYVLQAIQTLQDVYGNDE
jgi:hypothetical protein